MRALSLILCAIVAAAPALALFHKDVTAANFDTLLDPSSSHLLIEFYAPWCGHCKNLAPEYERLGEAFASSSDVVIAQVDADKHKNLAKRFSISGFPTLKWVPKGSTFDDMQDVNAPRSADGLLKYVNDQAGLSVKLKGAVPSSVVDLSSQSISQLKTSGSHAFVGFFAPWCGHCKSLKPTWEKLAQLYSEDDVQIGAVDCDDQKDLCEEYGVEGFPTLKYFAGTDVSSYKQGRTLDSLVDFVNKNAGLDISSDGGVHASAGVIEELAEHVGSYMSSSSEDERSTIVSTCNAKVDSLGGKAAEHFKYYAKVFAKIAEQGAGYVDKEKQRLQKVVDSSSSLQRKQRRGFLRRINVLNVFSK